MASKWTGLSFIPFSRYLINLLETNAQLNYYQHLIFLLEANAELKRRSEGTFKQMAWAAGIACLGGVVGGRRGALLGSIAGSCIGYYKSNKYKSMVVLLKNLTESDVEQQALVKKVQELVGSTTLEALTAFIGSQGQQELLWNVVVQFINDNITISRLYKIK